MESLKYKIIKTEEQYDEYCNLLETLVDQSETRELEEEIELLTFLIEKWDEEHSILKGDKNPVEMLKLLMQENQLKSKELAELVGISKSVISEILSYKKGFSKEIIRKLADRFKLRQETFNRPYNLKILSRNKVEESAI